MKQLISIGLVAACVSMSVFGMEPARQIAPTFKPRHYHYPERYEGGEKQATCCSWLASLMGDELPEPVHPDTNAAKATTDWTLRDEWEDIKYETQDKLSYDLFGKAVVATVVVAVAYTKLKSE